jgi:DNA-binding transcriptional regulator GbsR (MarR family)
MASPGVPLLDIADRSEYSERTMDDQSRRAFVDAWGAMGAIWGVNRSVARVHALLMTTEAPLSLEELAERLQISKGNASMSLADLRSFGVVRLVQVPGDRRDFYLSEPDVWTMFFRILRERKRREFDPAAEAVRRLLADAGARGPVRERLEQMDDLLSTLERVAERFLADPGASRSALGLLGGFAVGKRKKKKEARR